MSLPTPSDERWFNRLRAGLAQAERRPRLAPPDGVRPERTGWRDQEWSDRHRMWGQDRPMVDLDWVVIEYSRERVVALVEYKYHLAVVDLERRNASLNALTNLANLGHVPVFVVRYWKRPYAVKAWPYNPAAQALFTPRWVALSERAWVALLAQLSGTPLPAAVAQRLDATDPPDEP